MNKSRKNIDKIINGIKDANLPQTEFVKLMETFHDPFKVLICCILSLRTNDKTTYPCSVRMLDLGQTPYDFLDIDVDTLAAAIYPVGFYKVKAKNILEVSQMIIDDFNGNVPDEIDELLKLKGVGRKVANLVVTEAFDKDGICVDTHVHRISNRFGYVHTKTPEETEFALRDKLPKEYWRVYNDTLVVYGQNLCKPISPLCNKCTVSQYCDYFKNEYKENKKSKKSSNKSKD